MAWIIGGAMVVGGLLSATSSSSNTSSTNAANANLNQANMNFQERMSNTAIQRRMTDLRQADVNPLLAIGQNGASTPGFNPIAMQQNPNSTALGDSISRAGGSIATAMDVKMKAAQIDQIKAMTDATRAGQVAPGQPAANLAQTSADTQKSISSATNIEATTVLVGKQVQEAQAKIDNLNVQTATASKLMDAVVALKNLEVTQQKLGLPKLENDAAVQKALQPMFQRGSGPEGIAKWSDAGGVAKGVAHSAVEAVTDWFNALKTRVRNDYSHMSK